METPEQAELTHAYTKHFDETLTRWADNGRLISDSVVGGLRRYVVSRIPTGGFLRAVLENDLKSAAQQADAVNYGQLARIVEFCNDAIPFICWGSPAKVNEWLYAEAPSEVDQAEIESEREAARNL